MCVCGLARSGGGGGARLGAARADPAHLSPPSQADRLRSLFAARGALASLKLVRESGVAYVRYERASAAAAAVEQLHDTPLDGASGPTLRVLYADPPAGRRAGSGSAGAAAAASAPRALPPVSSSLLDPDDDPPRSRLFLVVPKSADVAALRASLAETGGLTHLKADFVPSKGVAYAKFERASAALAALEAVRDAGGGVGGIRVKAMLAEPRAARGARAPSGGGSLPSPGPSADDDRDSRSRGDRASASSEATGGVGGGRRGRRRRGAGGGDRDRGAAAPQPINLSTLQALATLRGGLGLGPLAGAWGGERESERGPSPARPPPPRPAASGESGTRAAAAADVASVGAGIAHLRTDDADGDGGDRDAPLLASLGLADEAFPPPIIAAGDVASSGAPPAVEARPAGRTVYTTLARPLPAYALEHVLSAHGPVATVTLHPGAPRSGVAVFADARSAAAAVAALDGTRVLGEALSVSLVDPLAADARAPAPHSKRPRIAGERGG